MSDTVADEPQHPDNSEPPTDLTAPPLSTPRALPVFEDDDDRAYVEWVHQFKPKETD